MRLTDKQKLRYLRWLTHGEVGVSSCTMWQALSGMSAGPRWSFGGSPSDADDFSRCYKLIKRFPEWKPRLDEVAALSLEWKRVIDNWPELSRLYRAYLKDTSLNVPNGHRMYELINGEPFRVGLRFEVRGAK